MNGFASFAFLFGWCLCATQAFAAGRPITDKEFLGWLDRYLAADRGVRKSGR